MGMMYFRLCEAKIHINFHDKKKYSGSSLHHQKESFFPTFFLFYSIEQEVFFSLFPFKFERV
jgi:hypothetical protein